MAENKQYITQAQDHGTVMISEDVIATIIIHTIGEVEGVAGLSTKPGADIAEKIGKKHWGKGLKIVIGENDALSIECNLILTYGQSVVAVAKSVQEAVTAALESTAGVKVACVNVNICGIAAQ